MSSDLAVAAVLAGFFEDVGDVSTLTGELVESLREIVERAAQLKMLVFVVGGKYQGDIGYVLDGSGVSGASFYVPVMLER